MNTHYKILIVEDDLGIFEAIKTKLSTVTYTVLNGKNGDEGLKIALKEHPDLILLDILMPIMNGVEMLKKLRKNDWGRTAKVLILTNLGYESKGKELKKLGIENDNYILKANWKLDELLKKIKTELEK